MLDVLIKQQKMQIIDMKYSTQNQKITPEIYKTG